MKNNTQSSFAKFILGASIFSFFAFQISNQQNPIFDDIIEKLRSYVTQESSEKIYLHTDKNFYVTGDTIWFKTYLIDGITHKASTKSSVVYVELSNDDTVVRRVLNTSNNGTASGDIAIPKDMVEGNYILRSFTKYMFNESSPVFFQKKIPIRQGSYRIEKTIYNSQEDDKVSLSLNKPIVQFFPEGGNLVSGLFNNVGVKAIASDGNDIEFKGEIRDAEENVKAIIKKYDFGLGVFGFVPEPNTVYHASININGDETQHQLPDALPSGNVLRIKNNGDHLIIKVNSNNLNGLEGTMLLGHLRGNPFYKYIGKPNDKQEYSLKLLTKGLADGVAHFTLFTSTGKPICERLTFIDNPENTLNLSINTYEKLYRQRDKITIDLKLSAIKKEKIEGDFSISIFSTGNNENDNAIGTNIKSWLLLDSDIKGRITNPNYFFESNTEERKSALDVLMLTHGWRRFVWKRFLNDNNRTPITYVPENGIIISGRTTAFDNVSLPRATKISMGIFGDGGNYQEQKNTNSNGEFSFGPFAFKDSINAILDAVNPYVKNKKKAKNISIFIDSPWPDSIPKSEKIIVSPSFPSKFRKPYLEDAHKQNRQNNESELTRLEGVVLTGKKKKTQVEIINEKIDAITLHGKPDRRLFLDSLRNIERLNLLDIINTLPGVQVKGDYSAETVNFNTSQKVRIRGGINSIQLSTEPHYLLDGVQVPLDVLKTISPREVKFIDLLVSGSASIYGTKGANGVIAVYTDRGVVLDLVLDQERSPGVTNVKIPGFYRAREFYAPDYKNNSSTQNRPDYRTTLHWQPNIHLKADKTVSLTFFAGDIKGSYQVVIEGLTNDGIPVMGTYQFEVD